MIDLGINLALRELLVNFEVNKFLNTLIQLIFAVTTSPVPNCKIYFIGLVIIPLVGFLKGRFM